MSLNSGLVERKVYHDLFVFSGTVYLRGRMGMLWH